MMKILIAATAIAISAPAVAAAVVGQPAPAFTATDSNGKSHSLSAYRGKTVVLEWTNAECPFVQKFYTAGDMQRTQSAARADGVVWLTINSGATGKQGNVNGQQANAIMKRQGFNSTAYLLDASGDIGRAYGAKTTPHMFVIDPKGTLVYAGGIDNIPSADPADIGKAQNFVKLALADIKAGKPVATTTSRPYGCSVKY
ncbi:thioredoxin family protein [Sandaracinobacteroides sp. A072]|uniref:thioredoxin family protein n=1 Tax=Sandaracinobacteroides sp. A072 TaxID=3461146 RepID=UPI0040413688